VILAITVSKLERKHGRSSQIIENEGVFGALASVIQQPSYSYSETYPNNWLSPYNVVKLRKE
jgi:hypothetical protein